MRQPRERQHAGFTIIEYMIAMTIMASILAFSTALFFSHQKSISSATSSGEEQANLRVLTVRMTKLLQNSQVLLSCVGAATCDSSYSPTNTTPNQAATGTAKFYNPDNNNQVTANIATGTTGPLHGLEDDWKVNTAATSVYLRDGSGNPMTYQGVLAFFKMKVGSTGINANGDPVFNYTGSGGSPGKLSLYYFDTKLHQLHYQEYSITNSAPPWQIDATYFFDSVVFSGYGGLQTDGVSHGDNQNGEITDFQISLATNPSAPSNWPANYPVSYAPPPGYVARVSFNFSYTIYEARTGQQNTTVGGMANRAILRQTLTVHVLNSA